MLVLILKCSKNRFSGTFEFFNRKTSDMLFSFPLPPSYGYTSYYANIGDMRNRGLELDLKGVILQTKDFYWDVNVNLTHYKNKVSYLPDERKTMTTPEGVQGYSSGNPFLRRRYSIVYILYAEICRCQ